jgi:hypothetical protein
LIDTSGAVVAAGVTDATGAFTLYQSTTPFTPSTGANFVLEVMKQVPGTSGKGWASLRTKLTKTSTAWDSITGPTIVVSALTTAVSQIDDDDPAIGYADIMGKVSGNTVTTFGSHSATEVLAISDGLLQMLASGQDASALKVFNGDVTIADTTDLATYADYEVINGNLNISTSTLTDVPLPNLKVVTGFVNIASSSLTDLKGLSGLTSIGNELDIDASTGLTSLHGLEHLTSVQSRLFIRYCSNLQSLEGLQNLTYVGGLYFHENTSLSTLLGLRGLKAIGGNGIMIDQHPNLSNLAGLEGVTSLAGNLELGAGVGDYTAGDFVSGLMSLKGLDNLMAIGGDLIIRNNNWLSTLDGGNNTGGLRKLTTVNGAVEISGNPGLSSTAGLAAYTGGGTSLSIFSNSSLMLDCNQPLPLIGFSDLIQFTNGVTLDNQGVPCPTPAPPQ